MRLLRSRVVWGLLLIVMGILFLLESLGILALGGAWSVLFIAAGLAFGYTFLEDRQAWWAVIPAMAFIGIGALIAVGVYLPEIGDQWGASIFLGSLALAFVIIYATTRTAEWWAIIPGGVLLSLAVALALEPFFAGEAFVAIFMLGMALTFVALYLLPTTEGRMSWALIPASILAIIGMVFLGLATELAGLVWPLALILVGAYLLIRNLRR